MAGENFKIIRSNEIKEQHFGLQGNGKRFSFNFGNIALEKADVVACPSNKLLKPCLTGGVAREIFIRGGSKIFREAELLADEEGVKSGKPEMGYGTAHFTNAGRLSAKYVSHLVYPDTKIVCGTLKFSAYVDRRDLAANKSNLMDAAKLHNATDLIIKDIQSLEDNELKELIMPHGRIQKRNCAFEHGHSEGKVRVLTYIPNERENALGGVLKSVAATFIKADKLGMKSVALPLPGTGFVGLPKLEILDAIFEETKIFFEYAKNLEYVKVIVSMETEIGIKNRIMQGKDTVFGKLSSLISQIINS